MSVPGEIQNLSLELAVTFFLKLLQCRKLNHRESAQARGGEKKDMVVTDYF